MQSKNMNQGTKIEGSSPKAPNSPNKDDLIKDFAFARSELSTEQSDCPSVPSVRADSGHLPLEPDFMTVVEEESDDNAVNNEVQRFD